MRLFKQITLLVLIVFIFSSSWLFSRVVTETEVETAAINWVKLENNLKNLRLNKFDVRISAIRELIYKDTLIGYIVDLEPRGFILVPTVSELAPVKFISFSGDYDGSEEHPFIETLKYRLYFTVTNLGYFKGEIQKTSDLVPSEEDIKQKEKNEGAWEKLLSEDFLPEIYLSAVSLNSVSPMLTSKWSQDYPYNAYVPEIDGQRCPVGCGNVSQAQVMYYWKYPTTGQGVNSYYWKDKYLSADFNHEYYWDRMFDSYTGSESQEQIDAVARLNSDVAISKDTYFGLSGSGGPTSTKESLVAFFKYGSDIKRVYRRDYLSWIDWFNVFKEQMERGWPATLGVCKKGYGCHSVVVDGYRVEAGVNQVHVNMGWGGLADNYYTIDNIYGYGNIEADHATINIYPPDCTNTGDISGKISDEIGNPLKDVQAKIYDQDENHVRSGWTDSTGNYVADCLEEGTFKIFFDASQAGDYQSEWHNDKDSFDAADSVSVIVGSSTTGIDAVLTELQDGCIKGKVTDSSGTGIVGVHVCAFYPTRSYHGCVSTDNNGDYEIKNLKTDSYKLRFDARYIPGWYALEWYNDKDSFEEADFVPVTEGSITEGVDAVLAIGGNIKGRVTDSYGVAIDDVSVVVHTPSGGHITGQWNDVYGYYEVKSLKSGSYKIYFDVAGDQGNYISEWYNDKDSCDTADLVSVIEESTTEGIDGVLSSTTPIITGKVTFSSGRALGGVTIAFSNGGGIVYTDYVGTYSNSVSVGWSGTVTPSWINYTFNPPSRSYSNVTSDQVGQDYTANTLEVPHKDSEKAGKKGGCFIATATYGSPLHPYVGTLRDFRDRFLMPSKFGRVLVNFYYMHSPFVAALITKHKALKVAVRINLLPLVAFSYSMLHFGLLITGIMLVLIFALPAFLISFFRGKLTRMKFKTPLKKNH
jgi:hypothetical protein